MQRALLLSSILVFMLIAPLSGREQIFSGGLQHTLIRSLPGGKPTCCEHEWNLRFLTYHPASVVPRRMYFAGCRKNTDNPRMLVSFSLGRNAKHPKNDPSSGAILQARLNASGKLEQEGRIRHFPECVWMEGIAASSDCGTVAALCRRRYNDRDYDFDALATHEARKWMTQPKCAKLSMWLYEWTNGDIHSKPKKILLHKAVDYDWEVGNSYLRLGENDGTYGIGLKSRVVDPKGQCHEADAFLVLDQASHKFTKRGYSWACGTGHTTFNRHAYNPRTKKYFSFCTTDGSPKRKTDKLGGLWFRPEGREAREFGQINNIAIHNKGGTGTVIPLGDGGFLGVIVGVPGKVPITKKMPRRPPTSVGLVRFSRWRGLVMKKWIVSKKDVYISHPQITRLGKDRFLLGYGEMKRLNDPADKNDESYRAPWAHYLVEIDGKGNFLTPVQKTTGAGWGEQDEMVSLGRGRVGWAYIPNPELRPGNVIPDCNSPALQLSAYVSRAPRLEPDDSEPEPDITETWVDCPLRSGRCRLPGDHAEEFWLRFEKNGRPSLVLLPGGSSFACAGKCEIKQITWQKCATEGGTCSVPGGKTLVRYGAFRPKKALWAYRRSTARTKVACTNAEWGDPYPNSPKVCQVVTPPDGLWPGNIESK